MRPLVFTGGTMDKDGKSYSLGYIIGYVLGKVINLYTSYLGGNENGKTRKGADKCK